MPSTSLLVAMLAIAGCGTETVPGMDAGGSDAAGDDAGEPPVDAAPPDPDAGTADAGGGTDAGRPDAGGGSDAGPPDSGPPPITVEPNGATIASGFAFGCAIDGGRVVCWGTNGSGQLGSGTIDAAPAGVEVVGIENARFVAAGVFHACVLREGGAVSCWGANGSGQLGDGSLSHEDCAGTDCARAPVAVAGEDHVAVSAGGTFGCALRQGGSVRCWGANNRGQLGDGRFVHERCRDQDCSYAPVDVADLFDAVEISAGGAFACARRIDGEVVCWGDNLDGTLGDGLRMHELCADTVLADCSRRPVAVEGIDDAVSISAGTNHACAVREDGSLSCWGSSTHGQLGDGVLEHTRCTDGLDCSRSPVPAAGIASAIAAAAGGGTTCVREEGGTVRCVGQNDYGTLGDGRLTGHEMCGTRDCSRSFVPTVTLDGAVELVSSRWRSCARLADGSVRCWGSNIGTSLGDGLATHERCSAFDCTSTPVRVTALD